MKSIAHGFDGIKDESLGLVDSGIGQPPHFRHRRSCKFLCTNQPLHADGAGLAEALVTQATRNWTAGQERGGAPSSSENWRFTRAGKMVPDDPSPEVTFERAFMEAADEHWANQVPTCSGVFRPEADHRRSIDLVKKTGNGSFEFIELKVCSDTPLFAALEVLDYGVLYVFSRIHARSLKYRPGCSAILDAHKIGLRVVAPRRFYEYKIRAGPWVPFDLGWLESMMRDAARQLASMIRGDTTIDFRFDVFSEGFSWPQQEYAGGDYALTMMAGRQPLITEAVD